MVAISGIRCPKCGEANDCDEESFKASGFTYRTSSYKCQKCGYSKDLQERIYESNKQA